MHYKDQFCITWNLWKSGSVFFAQRVFLFYSILTVRRVLKSEEVFRSLDLGSGAFSLKVDLQRNWPMIKSRYWSHLPLWIYYLSKISLVFSPKPLFLKKSAAIKTQDVWEKETSNLNHITRVIYRKVIKLLWYKSLIDFPCK